MKEEKKKVNLPSISLRLTLSKTENKFSAQLLHFSNFLFISFTKIRALSRWSHFLCSGWWSHLKFTETFHALSPSIHEGQIHDLLIASAGKWYACDNTAKEVNGLRATKKSQPIFHTFPPLSYFMPE